MPEVAYEDLVPYTTYYVVEIKIPKVKKDIRFFTSEDEADKFYDESVEKYQRQYKNRNTVENFMCKHRGMVE
jgi:hypothetical protein